MRIRHANPWVLLWSLAVCLPANALSPEAVRGRRVLHEAQCTRCHSVTDLSDAGRGVAAADRSLHCVDCHNWILDSRFDEAEASKQRRKFPDWDRYLENIVHFTALPDLGTLSRRVDPGFVRAYLDAPFDLRPHLDEGMIPVRLEAADKDALVTYLNELNGTATVAIPEGPQQIPSAERIAWGQRRFENLSCPTCHQVGNVELDAKIDPAFLAAVKEVAKNAPNLRFVRQRIPRDTLVRHILDPKAVDPRSQMPKQVVTADDAELISDWLLFGDVDADPPAVASQRPNIPVLSRRVLFDEVYGEVFGQICVHCHMNKRKNGGEGGPGNSGGLGFAAIELDLETYRGMKRGLKRDGKKVPLFKPEKRGQEPLLLESLLRRYDETSRDALNPVTDHGPGSRHADGRPGMPLALQPLSVEQLALIKTWLVQGAPGPKKRRRVATRRRR